MPFFHTSKGEIIINTHLHELNRYVEVKENRYKLLNFLTHLLDRPNNNVVLTTYAYYNKIMGKGKAEDTSKYGFCTSFSANEHFIFINEKQKQNEKIFTMVHELAHLFFGHVSLQFTYPDYERPDNQTAEYDCDLFASIMMFVINGALPIMKHYEVKPESGELA